jgi:HEAT repeat protein
MVRTRAVAAYSALTLAVAASAVASTPAEVLSLVQRTYLEDTAEEVRYASARLLSPRDHAAARQTLLACLEAEPTGLGKFDDCLSGLVATDDGLVRAMLVQRIQDAKTPITRAKVADAALTADRDPALQAVLELLLDTGRPREARVAREAAGPARMGGALGRQVIEAGYRRYGADDAAGRALAQSAFEVDPDWAGGMVLDAAVSSSWAARMGAARDLRRLPKPQARGPLVQLLTSDSAHGVRQVAADSLLSVDLVRLGEEATPMVLRADLSTSLREHLIDTLGRIRWLPAESALLQTLESSRPTLRAASARALGGIGSQAAAPRLLEILADRENPDPHWMRTWAARGLGGIRSSPVRMGLFDALRLDDIGYVIDGAARSLAAHQAPEGWALLRQGILASQRLETRVAAASALARDPESGAALAALLGPGEPPTLREAAALALGGVLGPDRLEGLRRATGDPDAEVRVAAWKSVGRRPDWARDLQALGEAALGEDAAAPVRLYAARALVRSGGPRAAEAIARATAQDQDRSVRLACLQGLANLDPERAVAAWRATLSGDPDRTLRMLAAGALDDAPEEGWVELRRAVLRDPEPGACCPRRGTSAPWCPATRRASCPSSLRSPGPGTS